MKKWRFADPVVVVLFVVWVFVGAVFLGGCAALEGVRQSVLCALDADCKREEVKQ